MLVNKRDLGVTEIFRAIESGRARNVCRIPHTALTFQTVLYEPGHLHLLMFLPKAVKRCLQSGLSIWTLVKCVRAENK